MKLKRKSKFTDSAGALKAEIVEWLYGGGSLLQYCAQSGKPSRRAIYEWVDEDPDFGAQFVHAREAGADSIGDMAQEVADDGTEDVQRSKLRVETLLKRAASFNPKRWGTKQQVDHSGGINVQVITGVPGAGTEGDVAE